MNTASRILKTANKFSVRKNTIATAPQTRVSTETVFELVEADGSAPVDVTLSFDTRDPYAVTMDLQIRGTDAPVTWVLSRSVLAEGLLIPAGVGDVQITPVTPEYVLLQLGGDQAATLWMSLAEIEEFLEDTYDVVAIGDESQYLATDILPGTYDPA